MGKSLHLSSFSSVSADTNNNLPHVIGMKRLNESGMWDVKEKERPGRLPSEGLRWGTWEAGR